MNRSEIKNLVSEALADYLETQDLQIDITEDTVLVGSGAVLDSMGFVNVVVDIESKFMDQNLNVSLTSDKAMSMRNSPFQRIGTLIDFIAELIQE